jgi:DNA-binding transcriptional ArsR family regulator
MQDAMTARTSAARLEHDSADALARATRQLGVRVVSEPTKKSGRADFELAIPGGRTVKVEVKAMAIPSADRVRELVRRPRRDALPVLVADQIPSPIRELLNDAGVGWFDRRGHIRLVADGLFIDADVAPQARLAGTTGHARQPINGRSGLAAAAGLLVRPDDPMGVSDLARVAGLNPSSITRAMTSLVDANLVERRNRGQYRPVVPELFWALADVWPREQVAIRWASPPDRDDRLAIGRDLSGPGWAAAGVRGGVAWGAPLVATADYPIHFYVPDDSIIRRVVALNAGGTADEAVVSADPVGLITTKRYENGALGWPLAHPVFCALDLTAAARDREALEQWTPPEGFTRVW